MQDYGFASSLWANNMVHDIMSKYYDTFLSYTLILFNWNLVIPNSCDITVSIMYCNSLSIIWFKKIILLHSPSRKF